jgi:hypothetical protein
LRLLFLKFNDEKGLNRDALQIDANGKIEVAQNKHLKKCGLPVNDSLLINDFEKSIIGYVFQSIKNKKMIARFGHVLKC